MKQRKLNTNIDRQGQNETEETKYTEESGLIGVNTGENDHDRTRNRWLIGEVSPGEEQKDPGKCGADDGTKQVRTTDCDNNRAAR